MATNKNAIIRYKVLNHCFSNFSKKYYFEDLLEACNKVLLEHNGPESGIKRRQLYKDIDFMKSEAGFVAPIKGFWDGRRKYYRYTEHSFSINNQSLNEMELHQLQEAVYMLSRFEGLPQFQWIHELLPRLRQNAFVDPTHTVIAYDENRYLKGIEFVSPLFNAIVNKQVLRILYRDFKEEKLWSFIIHPYFLKEYNNRWFLLGYNEENRDDSWRLALDRIEEVEPLRNKFCENKIDWDSHFEDVIGVTKKAGKKAVDVRLWFHPASAPYIITKPFHGSQKKISNDKKAGLVIKLNLIPNYEFYQWILFYGDRVKVLSPKRVANEVRNILKRALKQYEG